jgi:colanic acid biosynthesis glycosyl transferase WcaI
MTGGRLWIISELFYPEQTSTGYFLSEIARGLALDWDVSVICAQPTYSERGIKAPWQETWAGVNIHRMWSTRFDKDRLPLRLLNLATFTLSCLSFVLWRVRRGDRVLVVTNPPSIFPFIGFLTRIRGAKGLLLVHDVYPDVLSVTGHLDHRGLLYRVFDKMVSSACRQYDRIIVLGRDMRALMMSKSGLPPSRHAIIPNWGDIELVRPCSRKENSFAARHGMGDAFTVQFSGNIGRTHDVETLLASAKATADRRDIQYWFIGYGGKAAQLQAGSEESRSNVHVLPRQPRKVLGKMLASADVVVIAFIPGMKGLSVPSRMYNVMAAGTAIIAMTESGSELALVVEESGCGWVIPPNDDAALTKLLLALATPEGRIEVHEKGRAARRAASERYSLEHVLNAYNRLISSMCDEKPNRPAN